MDFGSTSTISVTSSTSEMNSTSQTQSKSKTSDSSFDKEMKSQEAKETKETDESKSSKDLKESKETSKDANKKVNEKENTNDKKNTTDENIMTAEILNGTVNFTDFKYNGESQNLLSQNIQSLLDTKSLISTINSASTFDYDVINMSDSDANFFANLVQHTDMSMQSLTEQITNSANKNITSSVQISSVLMEKLASSMKTNQPFRIDFDKDISVIIKVNKDGSLSANFIPGDKAVEQYLRNNISSLKQRFDDENLPYSELTYSNQRDKQQQQQRRKKENDNE